MPTAATPATPSGGRPSGNSPTRTAEPPAGGFPLAGPSALPDPRTHAFRQDLADAALAGRVIASHYAEPLAFRLVEAAALLADRADNAEELALLEAGSEMRVLDISRGWAWGYAAGLVGYVRAGAIGC